MFQWMFNALWSRTQSRPGTGLEALRVTVRHGRRYRATVTLSGFEQFVATNEAIAGKLTGVGFKGVDVRGDGPRRTAEGIWDKPDTAAELDPHLSNVVEVDAAVASPAKSPAPTPVVLTPAASTTAAAASVPLAPVTVVATTPAKALERSVMLNENLESVSFGGRPVPSDYFLFAADVLTEKEINKAKNEHGRVMVGFDSGGIPQTGEIYVPAFKLARDIGAELEIYVEGPGGPTAGTWDEGERVRTRLAAEMIGIDTREKNWRAHAWEAGGGWKTYTFVQLERYRKQGFNAAEIDNLEHVLKSPDALIAFYKEYAPRAVAGTIPQLIMKNVGETDMKRVCDAVKSGELPRAMFSEFHIYECGNAEQRDEWKPVHELSKQIGIRTVPSRNTNKYDAKGVFGLKTEFDTAYGLTGPKPNRASDTPLA